MHPGSNTPELLWPVHFEADTSKLCGGRMKAFPQTLLDKIFQDIERLASAPVDQRVAAFDADGTLWSIDVGEQFFKFQIASGELKGLPPDPWEHYHRMKAEVSPQAAYIWLAQINEGQKLEKVREWAKTSLEASAPIPVFDFQRKIVEKLKSLHFKIYIVTASIAWAVEPAAALFGLPYEAVIGVRTKVKNGYVTTEQDGIITYRQGKVDALLEATQGLHPLFVSGNTEGDLLLLESSKGIRLVVGSADASDSNYGTEQRMQEIARKNNWYSYQA